MTRAKRPAEPALTSEGRTLQADALDQRGLQCLSASNLPPAEAPKSGHSSRPGRGASAQCGSGDAATRPDRGASLWGEAERYVAGLYELMEARR